MDGRNILIILWLVGLTWLVGGGLILATSTFVRLAENRKRHPGSGFLAYILITLAVPLVYAIVHWSTLNVDPGQQGVPQGAERSEILYLLFLFGILLLGLVWPYVMRRLEPQTSTLSSNKMSLWVAPIAILAAITLSFFSNANVVIADIYYKEAWTGYHARASSAPDFANSMQFYSAAVARYEKAQSLNPGEDYYMLFKGKALLESAAREASAFEQRIAAVLPTDPEDLASFSEYTSSDDEVLLPAQARDKRFEEAVAELSRALETADKNPDHHANMGRAYQIWGESTRDVGKRAERLQESVKWFDDIIENFSPSVASLREESANTLYLLGDIEAANERIDEALEIDPSYGRPIRLRARMHRESGEWESAIENYRAYLESRDGRSDMAGWSELAWVYGQVNNVDGAIEANERVTQLSEKRFGTHDITSLTNLALLMEMKGTPEKGCEYVAQGLAIAEDDPALLALAQRLNCQQLGSNPGATESGAAGASAPGEPVPPADEPAGDTSDDEASDDSADDDA